MKNKKLLIIIILILFVVIFIFFNLNMFVNMRGSVNSKSSNTTHKNTEEKKPKKAKSNNNEQKKEKIEERNSTSKTVISTKKRTNSINNASSNNFINDTNIENNYSSMVKIITADYSKLNKMINNYYKESDNYTDFSRLEVDSYIKNIDYEKCAENQNEVDNYVLSLNKLLDKLVLKPADYTMLDSLINNYKNSDAYKNEWYIKESKDKVDSYIEYINSFPKDLKINEQFVLDDLENNLRNRINDLILKPASYIDLYEIIFEYQDNYNFKNNYYTEESKEKVDNFLEEIDYDRTIDKQEYVFDDMLHLIDLINNLKIKPADYTGLNNLIKEYKTSQAYVSNWYIEDGKKQEVDSYIEYINSFPKDLKINEQFVLDDLKNNLTNKINNLALKPADYEALYNKIFEYQDGEYFINNYYTEESKEKVDNYLHSIKYDETINNQSNIDNNLVELSKLISELELKPADYSQLDTIIDNYHNSELYINDKYTLESKNEVDNYINSINRNIKINEQYIITNYINELNSRILNLVLKLDFYKPTTSGRISASYGYVQGKLHNGIDIAAPIGTNVYSISNGVVLKTGYSSVDGYYIVIIHNINDKYYTSYYSHMQKNNISEGESVTKDTVIGQVGNSGESTNSHLHLSIAYGRWYVDYYSINDFNSRTINPISLISFPSLGEPYYER